MPLVNRAFALLSRWTGLQLPLRRNPCIVDRVEPLTVAIFPFVHPCADAAGAFDPRCLFKRQHAPLKVGDPLFDHRFVHILTLI